MLSIKSKIKVVLINLFVVSTLALPTISQAEDSYESGGIAARRAAEQKAALAKKAEERKRKAEEAKKSADEPDATKNQNAAEGQPNNMPLN
jgi:hypothetical protein